MCYHSNQKSNALHLSQRWPNVSWCHPVASELWLWKWALVLSSIQAIPTTHLSPHSIFLPFFPFSFCFLPIIGGIEGVQNAQALNLGRRENCLTLQIHEINLNPQNSVTKETRTWTIYMGIQMKRFFFLALNNHHLLLNVDLAKEGMSINK